MWIVDVVGSKQYVYIKTLVYMKYMLTGDVVGSKLEISLPMMKFMHQARSVARHWLHKQGECVVRRNHLVSFGKLVF
jgi:hypothetical protein